METIDAKQGCFFSEMADHQISAREFFSTVLLDSLERNFKLQNAVIVYYDTNGKFLSSVTKQGIMMDGPEHPYRKFIAENVVRHIVYEEACRDHLTYFNLSPRLYRSTDIIAKEGYDQSAHVRFLEENFHAHYSVTLAFGINAYIEVAFFKTKEEGDFTEAEMNELSEIYGYIANAYKNFKKYEQAKIISNIQSEVIASGEKAYLITDDFMHVMSYNEIAEGYLKDILGPLVEVQIDSSTPCSWLPFLLGSEGTEYNEERVQTRVIKDYIFKVYTYDRSYSNGIVDRYHWITISRKNEEPLEKRKENTPEEQLPLTQTERKVAELMCKGLTYKAIADELVISYHTVKKHVQNIYTKCGIQSRFQLYKWMGY